LIFDILRSAMKIDVNGTPGLYLTDEDLNLLGRGSVDYYAKISDHEVLTPTTLFVHLLNVHELVQSEIDISDKVDLLNLSVELLGNLLDKTFGNLLDDHMDMNEIRGVAKSVPAGIRNSLLRLHILVLYGIDSLLGSETVSHYDLKALAHKGRIHFNYVDNEKRVSEYKVDWHEYSSLILPAGRHSGGGVPYNEVRDLISYGVAGYLNSIQAALSEVV